jgi:hypothetical protein
VPLTRKYCIECALYYVSSAQIARIGVIYKCIRSASVVPCHSTA